MVTLIETNQVFAHEEASSLSRLAGPVRGVATEDWPVYQGHPMQHFFTIDLRAVQIDLPAAKDARLLVVFTMAFFELGPDMSDAIVMRWVSDDDLERIDESSPPDGFELIGEIHEEHYEKHDLVLEFVEEEDEPSYYNDFVGQSPAWPEHGKPAVCPEGGFILQMSSDNFPITRQSSTLYLFEGGAQILRHEPPEEDEAMAVVWPEAITSSREFVIEDAQPEPEAIQKWGGLPRGIPEDDWPEDCYHLLTFEPSFWSQERPDNALAIAVFAPQEATEWDEQPEFQTVFVRSEALDETVEAPEGITVLPQRCLTLRPFAKEASYYDLRLSSYEGPRLAWLSPMQSCEEFEEGTFGFQLTHDLLSNAPTKGTLYFDSKNELPPIWQAARS